MNKVRFVYWEVDDGWLGYLEEFPDYMTEGKTYDELKENLRDLAGDLISGVIPSPHRIGELEIA